ncbi:MAG: hypothetical protein RBQ97_10290 [Acholeplasma sp.]|nr:hypothetical protein [Acholeplasma sp.]
MEVKLIKVKDNPHGYKFIVQLWFNGYYSGNGKFFKDKKSAKKYIKKNKGESKN